MTDDVYYCDFRADHDLRSFTDECEGLKLDGGSVSQRLSFIDVCRHRTSDVDKSLRSLIHRHATDSGTDFFVSTFRAAILFS